MFLVKLLLNLGSQCHFVTFHPFLSEEIFTFQWMFFPSLWCVSDFSSPQHSPSQPYIYYYQRYSDDTAQSRIQWTPKSWATLHLYIRFMWSFQNDHSFICCTSVFSKHSVYSRFCATLLDFWFLSIHSLHTKFQFEMFQTSTMQIVSWQR